MTQNITFTQNLTVLLNVTLKFKIGGEWEDILPWKREDIL